MISTTALYAVIIASVLVASMFAISYVQQQALAQGNQTGRAAGSTNQSSSNSTTSGGVATGASSDPNFWTKTY